MSATERQESLEAPTLVQSVSGYETCEQCEAPVESTQRYCVACGSHRKHVYDPAARFLSGATSRSRTSSGTRGTSGRRQRPSGLGLALVLAAIPLAVAAGVLIGRPGDQVNSKLLAALRDQKPTIVNVAGGAQTAAASTPGAAASSSAAATPVSRLTSTFGLQQGYAVELQTLRGSGATQATVSAAERRARARGASAVGLISPADFRITPAPPAGEYVIYSGQYRTSAQATAALAKLRHAFPSAKVIAVRSVSAGPSGPVVSTTQYGSAHQVSGFKASAGQLATGAKVVKQVSKEVNGSYVKSQQGLPDAISVP